MTYCNHFLKLLLAAAWLDQKVKPEIILPKNIEASPLVMKTFGGKLTNSRYYQDPKTAFSKNFETIEPCDTVQIIRGGKVAKLAFIYRIKNMKALPDDPLFFY